MLTRLQEPTTACLAHQCLWTAELNMHVCQAIKLMLVLYCEAVPAAVSVANDSQLSSCGTY